MEVGWNTKLMVKPLETVPHVVALLGTFKAIPGLTIETPVGLEEAM